MAIIGTVNVVGAGTAVQVGKNGNVTSVTFISRSDNNGAVYVGTSDVTSTNGVYLGPGDHVRLPFRGKDRLESFWCDADNADENIDFVADNTAREV